MRSTGSSICLPMSRVTTCASRLIVSVLAQILCKNSANIYNMEKQLLKFYCHVYIVINNEFIIV